MAVRKVERISGRVGGEAAGFDLELTWDGTRLKGCVDGSVTGRVGGGLEGYDVAGLLQPDRVEVRFGGNTLGQDLRLELARSRLGGGLIGNDVRLEHSGEQLSGRIGGRMDGKDVRLSTQAPPEVAALAAAIAFQLLEESAAGAG